MELQQQPEKETGIREDKDSGGGRHVKGVMLGNRSERRISVCQPDAVMDFLSSSSSLSLKSSRFPMSKGLTLIRLARLCMSSSLRSKDTTFIITVRYSHRYEKLLIRDNMISVVVCFIYK